MDLAEIAYNLIHVVLKIKQGHVVNLSAEIHNGYELDNPLIEIPFLEEIALAIRKKRAFPVLDIASENLRKRSFAEINNDDLHLPQQYYEKWVSMSDIFVDFGWKSNPYFIQDIPPRFIKQYTKTMNDLWEQIQKQNKKIVLMGFPTEALAKYYSINYSLLKDCYFEALNCNYQLLKKSVYLMDAQLNKSAEWNIVSEDRNLKVKFTEQDAYCFFGDFLNQCYIVLPTGKIEKQIEVSSLDGILYADTMYFENKVYSDIQIIFDQGKIHSVDFLNRLSGDHFIHNLLLNHIESAYLCIGMNPNLKQVIKYTLFDECVYKNTSIKLLINNKVITLANVKAKIFQHDKDILSEV